MRISDWSSDVCSSDLKGQGGPPTLWAGGVSGDRPIALLRIDDDAGLAFADGLLQASAFWNAHGLEADLVAIAATTALRDALQARFDAHAKQYPPPGGRQNLFALRSEEHTSELQSIMRNSYAVFCLKKK